jgi:hypothetical protein
MAKTMMSESDVDDDEVGVTSVQKKSAKDFSAKLRIDSY